MIVDTIKNSGKYILANKYFERAFKYINNTDFTNMPEGKYEIYNEDVFAILQIYDSIPEIQGSWEAHRNFIDIHYIIQGEEYLGYANINDQQIERYIEEKDKYLLEGDGSFVKLRKGHFAICYPEDSHMTGISTGQSEKIKKIVIKVKI